MNNDNYNLQEQVLKKLFDDNIQEQNTEKHKANFLFIGKVSSTFKGKYFDKFKESYQEFFVINLKVKNSFYRITFFDSEIFKNFGELQDKEVRIIGEIGVRKDAKTNEYETTFIGSSLLNM